MLKTAFKTRPLYLQVRDLLVSKISSGEWKPRTALPNEVDLARELNVSPGTVRRALKEMEDEHLIYRRQGRGTFVADHTSEELAIRFTNIRTNRGERLSGRIGASVIRRGLATEMEQKRLGLRAHASVKRIHRVAWHEDQPFMVEDVCLPDFLFPGLGEDGEIPHALTQLAQQFSLLLGRAEEQVRIGLADHTTAGELLVEEETPILELDRVVYTLDGQPAEWRLARCHLVNAVYWTEMS